MLNVQFSSELRGENYVLSGGYTEEDELLSPVFPKLNLDMRRIFDFPLDAGEKVEMVKESHPPYGASAR